MNLRLKLWMFSSLICDCFSDLRRSAAENQLENHTWNQTGERPSQEPRGEPGGPPAAKRLKPSPDGQQQQPTNTPPSTQTLSSLLSSSPCPTPPRSILPSILPPSHLGRHSAPLGSSSPKRPQHPSTRHPHHLQARMGGSGGGSRWSLRQNVGQQSLARRILGKVHLHQRVLADRGAETELLTYQETEDLQVGGATVQNNPTM